MTPIHDKLDLFMCFTTKYMLSWLDSDHQMSDVHALFLLFVCLFFLSIRSFCLTKHQL